MSRYYDKDDHHGSACCPKDSCDDVCPDVCSEVCISGTVQRGEFLLEKENGNFKAAAFVITLTVSNRTGEVLTNFRPRLQFRLLDPNATDNNNASFSGTQQIVTLSNSDDVRSIITSIGCPNHQNDSSDPVPQNPWNGNDSTALLSKGVNLPPGCTNLKLYLFLENSVEKPCPPIDRDYTTLVLLPPVFSVIGQIKCCFGECRKVHKSVHLDCECLPLELNQ